MGFNNGNVFKTKVMSFLSSKIYIVFQARVNLRETEDTRMSGEAAAERRPKLLLPSGEKTFPPPPPLFDLLYSTRLTPHVWTKKNPMIYLERRRRHISVLATPCLLQ